MNYLRASEIGRAGLADGDRLHPLSTSGHSGLTRVLAALAGVRVPPLAQQCALKRQDVAPSLAAVAVRDAVKNRWEVS